MKWGTIIQPEFKLLLCIIDKELCWIEHSHEAIMIWEYSGFSSDE